MAAKRQAQGFTLIELSIVIIIMAFAAALVAPLGFEELEKSRAKTEFLTLRNTIKLHTSKAFAQGLRYQMAMFKQTLTVKSALGERQYHYDYIGLPNLTFHINANGYPSVNEFEVSLGKNSRKITIEDMLGVKQDMIYAEQ